MGKKGTAETVKSGSERPAVKNGTVGAGVMVGSPIGPHVKYWFNPNLALGVGLGFQDDFVLYSDVLWHEWSLLPQPPRGTIAGYLGLGLRFEERGNENHDKLGVRTVIGASYWVPKIPIEVVVEVAPVFRISPSSHTEFDGGIGARYYFMGL